MNKATRTSLHAMRKSELIDFTWNIIQHYNESTRRVEDLEMMKDTLERLLLRTREQAGIIRTGVGEQY